MGVTKGKVQVVNVYPSLLTGPQHCSSKCSEFLVPCYPSGLNVVAELLLAEKHASIKHVRRCVVKGNNVLLWVTLSEQRS